MSMNVGSADAEDEVVSTINTTPLVDVMLVLLIIFLITVPVAIQTAKVSLPLETNIATQTKPENITISVDKEGQIFWGQQLVPDNKDLVNRLKEVAVIVPQPEVHIRGDRVARYEPVGRVVFACMRAGIVKVGFITEPPPRG